MLGRALMLFSVIALFAAAACGGKVVLDGAGAAGGGATSATGGQTTCTPGETPPPSTNPCPSCFCGNVEICVDGVWKCNCGSCPPP
jgi:hypothetical protein